MSFEFISSALQERRQSQLLRTRTEVSAASGRIIRVQGKEYLNFSSNDYLGMAFSPELINAWQQGAAKYGVGSGASPLVTGHCSAHAALEQQLCEWLNVEAVILFNSGFSANQAIIKALLNTGDLLLQDKLNHASLIEAGLLSTATMKRFLHNDLNSLIKLIATPANNKLVVTEGIFSMDGDAAPILDISRICQENDAWLMVDDAHALGVLGTKGQGSVSSECANAVQIRMATFGKALGVGGAFIGGSKDFIAYLINFSRSYIYSTAMPPAMAYTVSKSIEILQNQSWRRDKLFELIEYFKELVRPLPVTLLPSNSAIQPLVLGSSEQALKISQALAGLGFWVAAIRPPTVPQNSARCRITLSCNHTKQDIESLVAALSHCLREA